MPFTYFWMGLSTMNGSYEESKYKLFENQKALLDTFLAHGAISQAQYDKSLGDLRTKMGIDGARFSKKRLENR